MASCYSATNPLLGVQITEKLKKTNHVLWKAQVITAIRGACLQDHIIGKPDVPAPEIEAKQTDGKVIKSPNPAYEEWFARDQQVLGLIYSSVGKDVFIQIAAANTAAQVWQEIERMFTAQFCARTMNVRLTKTTTKKGTMSITENFGMMKSYADETTAS